MILLQEIGLAQARSARECLANAGCAPVLVHPFYFGVSVEERAKVLATIVAQTPSAAPGLAEEIVGDQEVYRRGLRKAIAHPIFNKVGFVFESVDHLHHIAELESFDPSYNWIVISTRQRGADPTDASWAHTMQTMADWGLVEAYVGGCYCVIYRSGVPVSTNAFYSCVNDVWTRMRVSGLFSAVHLARSCTYETYLPAGS